MSNIELKKQQLETAVKWVGGIGIVLVVGTVAIAVIKSVTAIAVAGVAGLGLVNGMPVVARKFASWKYNALRRDAIENPIPNLLSSLENEKANFKRLKDGVIKFAATAKNFQAKIQTYRNKGSDVSAMLLMYDDMKRVLAVQVQALEERKIMLEEFNTQIGEAQDAYNMALDMREAGDAMEAFSGQPAQDMLLRNEALQSIQTKLHEQQARMEVTMKLDFNALPHDVKAVDVLHLEDINKRLEVA